MRAPVVMIDGRLEGDVHATERVELAAKARVQGNVHYKVVEMPAGAQADRPPGPRRRHPGGGARRPVAGGGQRRLSPGSSQGPRRLIGRRRARILSRMEPTVPHLPAARRPRCSSRRRGRQGARTDRRGRQRRRSSCACTSRAAAARASSTASSSTKQQGEDDLAVADRRRHAAGRSAQPAVPDGRGSRLQRKPAGRAVRDPQSEREDHLRLRQQLHRVTATSRRLSPSSTARSIAPTISRRRRNPRARCGRRRASSLLDEDGRAFADGDEALLAPRRRDARRRPRHRDLPRPARRAARGSRNGAATWPSTRPARIDLRSAATQWPAFDATVFAQARAMLHWHARHRFCGACGGELAIRARRLARPLRAMRQRTLPAHRPGDHRRGQRRPAPVARSPAQLAGAALVGDRRFRRTRRIARTDRRPRSAGGNRRARAREPLRRLATVAVPRFADARLPRRSRAPTSPWSGEELEDARWFDADTIRAGLARDWAVGPEEDEGGIGCPRRFPSHVG